MSSASVFVPLLEDFLAGQTIIIVVAFEPTCHPKIVYKKWVLVDMFKDAESSL